MSNPYGSTGSSEGASSGSGGWGQPAAASDQGASGQGQWGQQAPQGQWGQASPAAAGSPSPYGGSPFSAPAPVKKRGLKRIIFGIIALLLGIIGVVAGAVLGAVIGMVVSLTSISGDDVTPVSAGAPVSISSSSIYLIGSTDPTATCTAEGPGVEVDDQSGAMTFEKDGTTYTAMSRLTSTSGGEVAVSCTGGDVAIAEIGVGGTVIGFLIGVGIPVLIGLLGLILLISGIVARVRSGRGR